jgi:hypothetical protein
VFSGGVECTITGLITLCRACATSSVAHNKKEHNRSSALVQKQYDGME